MRLKEFFVISKVQLILVYFIHLLINEFKLVGYSYSDWGGDVHHMWMIQKAQLDLSFTWSSKEQPIVTLSTCEAEYIAAT